MIELMEILFDFAIELLSPIKEDKPLPNPFFNLKVFVMLHSPLFFLD